MEKNEFNPSSYALTFHINHYFCGTLLCRKVFYITMQNRNIWCLYIGLRTVQALFQQMPHTERVLVHLSWMKNKRYFPIISHNAEQLHNQVSWQIGSTGTPIQLEGCQHSPVLLYAPFLYHEKWKFLKLGWNRSCIFDT